MNSTDILQHLDEATSKRLKGKVAIITGGDQGIGRAIAVRFAAEGADIAFSYRTNRQGATEVQEQIAALGCRAFTSAADLGDTAQARRFIQGAFENFSTAHILVNNAGLEKRASFWEVSEEDYDRVLNVNLKGLFFTTQATVRRWIESKQTGKIINISSVHEELSFPHFSPYSASKGGVRMLTRTLAVELAQFGITINSIAPGAIITPINKSLLESPQRLESLLQNIPLKRLGTGEDVAGVAAFLASADADYMTGTTVVVDGGLLCHYEEQ